MLHSERAMKHRTLFLLPTLFLFALPAQADFLKSLGNAVDKSVNKRIEREKRKSERKIDRALDVERNINKAEREAIKAAENRDSRRGVHECGDADELVLEDISIKAPKTQWGVVVKGSCTLTLKNVRISGARGILIEGAAKVNLEKVRIQTAKRGISASGAAEIKMTQSTLRVRDKKNAAISAKGAVDMMLFDTKVYAKNAMAFDEASTIDLDDKSRVNGKKFQR